MYIAPYTGNHIVPKRDQRDTLSLAARVGLRSRAEAMFAAFLDDKHSLEQIRHDYPVLFRLHEHIKERNLRLPIGSKDDVLSSDYVRYTELRYLRLIRRLNSAQSSEGLSSFGILEAVMFRLELIAQGAPLTGQFQAANRAGE